ncbi:MAG TPA: hypothetical protein H9902_10750 [Candidatus Stackebrandtia faecavium]|nr:hypothetical protein [Candidatus Stackebrandtia faecavium]
MKQATTCKRCGAAIAQQPGRGRPRQYCESGDCQQAAKRQRQLRRSTPGLEGALARAEDLYDRIDTDLAAAIQPLAEALRAEFDPAGVEEKIAAAQRDAEARVSAARAERDDAVAHTRAAQNEAQEARSARDEAAAQREQAEDKARRAVGERDEAAAEAQQSAAERDTATAEAAQARQDAQAARAQADTAISQRDEAIASRNEAREQAVRAHEETESARRELATITVERDVAAKSAERAEQQRLAAATQEAIAITQRDHAIEERDEAIAEKDTVVEGLRERLATMELRAGEAIANRDRFAQDNASLTQRLDDCRQQLTQARQDANALRERAVTAEHNAEAARVELREAVQQLGADAEHDRPHNT